MEPWRRGNTQRVITCSHSEPQADRVGEDLSSSCHGADPILPLFALFLFTKKMKDRARLSTFVVTFYGHESTQVSTILVRHSIQKRALYSAEFVNRALMPTV